MQPVTPFGERQEQRYKEARATPVGSRTPEVRTPVSTPQRSRKKPASTSKALPVARGSKMSANMAAFMAAQQKQSSKKSTGRRVARSESGTPTRSITSSPTVYPNRQQISGCRIPSPHIRSLSLKQPTPKSSLAPSLADSLSPQNGAPPSIKSGDEQRQDPVSSQAQDIDADNVIIGSNLNKSSALASANRRTTNESDPDSDVTSLTHDRHSRTLSTPPPSDSNDSDCGLRAVMSGSLKRGGPSPSPRVVEMVSTPQKGSTGNIPPGFPGHTGYVGAVRYVAVSSPIAEERPKLHHVDEDRALSSDPKGPASFSTHISRASLPDTRVAASTDFLTVDAAKHATSTRSSSNDRRLSSSSNGSVRSNKSHTKLVCAL